MGNTQGTCCSRKSLLSYLNRFTRYQRGVDIFPSYWNYSYEKICLTIKKKAAIESCSINVSKMFYNFFAKSCSWILLLCTGRKKALENNCEVFHFSKAAGLLSLILLKMNSFTGILKFFRHQVQYSCFAEHMSVAASESNNLEILRIIEVAIKWCCSFSTLQ